MQTQWKRVKPVDCGQSEENTRTCEYNKESLSPESCSEIFTLSNNPNVNLCVGNFQTTQMLIYVGGGGDFQTTQMLIYVWGIFKQPKCWHMCGGLSNNPNVDICVGDFQTIQMLVYVWGTFKQPKCWYMCGGLSNNPNVDICVGDFQTTQMLIYVWGTFKQPKCWYMCGGLSNDLNVDICVGDFRTTQMLIYVWGTFKRPKCWYIMCGELMGVCQLRPVMIHWSGQRTCTIEEAIQARSWRWLGRVCRFCIQLCSHNRLTVDISCHITHAIILTVSMNLLQKVESGMGCPDWHTAMHSLGLQRLLWIYCPGHAGVRGNERADKRASTAHITSDLQLLAGQKCSEAWKIF